jgi:autotransporter-associated beta strand protein
MQTAYGISAISLGGVAGTGSGQTIAIVDAFDDPNIVSDAAAFNSQFGLQQFNVSGGPTLTVLNQTAGATPPTASGTTGWSVEESLDVEWAHSIAPQANIILFEADSDSFSDLFATTRTAAAYSGVSVVSMSWGGGEFDGENAYDSYFTTPAGHQGVTFLASTGDDGSPGIYPAVSPNVVGVGGTSLYLDSDNTNNSETGWSGSGGGPSVYEPEPPCQEGVQSSGAREIPDVAFDADPYTGVAVYDTYDAEYNSGYYGTNPWAQFGGTSLSAPCFAGLISIADQYRAARGRGTLDGPSQTLPTLYAIDADDYHDIVSGSNGGHSAGLGYDMVTGLGSPVANQLVPDLALYPAGTVTSPATTVSLAVSTGAPQYSVPITFAATVSDSNAGVAPPAGTVTFEDGGTAIGTATLARGMAFFTDSSLALGSHTITAVYGGDATFTGSTSGPLSEVVAPLATITSLSAAARAITYGQAETLTATVSGLLSGTATPTGGTVTFADQATSATLGTATLAAGTASITISSLTAGMHEIVATYHGDGRYFLGSSASLSLGPIGTVAGNGWASYGGDGGPATAAQIGSPSSVAVDAAGDLFIADTANNRIREVVADTGNFRVREAAAPTINVARAPLVVTANNQTKVFAAPLPPLTASFSGLVNGDTAAGLTTPPTLSTTATASSPVGTYPINVSGAVDPNYNISYVTGTLTIVQDVPAVSGVMANSGPTNGGTTVTITGTNLAYVTAVKFGGVAASSFTAISNTRIVATSPAGAAGTVDVTLATADGASAISPADQFRYVAAPLVSGIGASSGSVWGDTPVNVYGSNLADATTAVFFGTTPAVAFSIVSPSQIVALSPAGAGTVDVTVVTAGGSSPIVPAVQFTYLAATLTWDAAEGNWTDAQWSGPGLPYPDRGANAIVGAGGVVQVTSPQAANALTIQSGGQVAVGPGAVLSVTTDTSITGGSTLNVDPSGAFSSGGALTLDTGGSLTGGPVAAAAFQFNDGTVSADLSGPGGLTKDTGGTVVLCGANFYAGGTVVDDGTLIAAGAAALPDGTNLTIGAGATLLFDPSQAAVGASAVAASASAARIAPAPETPAPILAAAAAQSVPPAASVVSSPSPFVQSQVADLSYGPVAAPARAPSVISRAAVDAVFASHPAGFDRTLSSPDRASSAGAWTWLAADQDRSPGPAAAAADKVLAWYGA